MAMFRDRAAAHDASRDPKVEPVTEQPQCVVGPMRDYQLEGLRWLVSRVGDSGVNAILADEMVRVRSGPQKRKPYACWHFTSACMWICGHPARAGAEEEEQCNSSSSSAPPRAGCPILCPQAN